MQLRGRMKSSNPVLKMLVWFLLMAVLTTLMMGAYLAYVSATGSNTINTLRALQGMQALFLFILPALGAAYLWSDQPLRRLGMHRGFSWQAGLLALLLIIVAQPGINLISWWNESWNLPEWLDLMEDNTDELTKQLAYSSNFGMLLLNILIMAILPGFGEEICFRGVLLGQLTENAPSRRKESLYVWMVAIVFSAIHLQFAGFVPRMLLGAVLGYLFVWSGSLWLPVLAHATNNAFVVVMYYLGEHTTITPEAIDAFGREDTWWVGLISIILTALLLWALRTFALKQSSAPRPAAPAE